MVLVHAGGPRRTRTSRILRCKPLATRPARTCANRSCSDHDCPYRRICQPDAHPATSARRGCRRRDRNAPSRIRGLPRCSSLNQAWSAHTTFTKNLTNIERSAWLVGNAMPCSACDAGISPSVLHKSIRLSFSVRQFKSGISPSKSIRLSFSVRHFKSGISPSVFQSGSAFFKCMHNIHLD